MSDDDPRIERVQEWLRRANAEHERQVLASAEAADAFAWSPAPMTAHPSLERSADGVRAFMDIGRITVDVAIAPSIKAMVELDPDPIGCLPKIETLHVQTASGPAPYTWPPYQYTWQVAVGEGQRYVAGEATVEYEPFWVAPTANVRKNRDGRS